jgi:hypothetical protein
MKKLSNAAVSRIKQSVSMPKSAFVAEHKKLVGILKHGSKAVRSSEASKQAKELKK